MSSSTLPTVTRVLRVRIKDKHAAWLNEQVRFNGQHLSLWDSYGLAGFELRAGNFSEDSRGRWYLNVTVQVPKTALSTNPNTAVVGLDLGLKDFRVTSEGETVEAQRFYRFTLEGAIATAQRANKWQRDGNAARNILAAGRDRLAGGITVLQGGEDVNKNAPYI